ncbi:beta-glucosidase family protein [Streptomyces millisiae]|uniref:Glycoside hydrolase family 3 C-terminal domain-containing protein n=1 Tax=Streptomyces millisiae TaxID=3075542 RepID=A0ABU2LJZ3_9ACTN|nr:glycoside hydrolase family 3 C-terminal domain-containing protein [Streptomyces sp. DSM 44918]MDT0317917.1 glycoside hydrolase family 3 C-terminal domain-containing protein [Streptomyces sp. DSM 44918]
MPLTLDSPELHRLVARLPLETKVRLLTGRDFWTTWPVESIGLRRMVLSDGPSGVRGEVWDERSPSLNLPSATALSSSWDPDLAYRYGAVLAAEARRKGVDVVLGPTINLHRSPLGGRHFEAFSEDPVLTADLAAAFVSGLQDHGVAATPKHYVANDYETERFTASTEVSQRALRELYLLAFEKAVVESRPWLVMSAYNAINGVTATEHELLDTPLKSEWGFDGVVVSDWTAVRSLASAEAEQDLVMPGPEGPWGDALLSAVREGRIPETTIDRKVRRILLLASRVGALDGHEPAAPPRVTASDNVAFARHAATAGTVLLANDGTLPLAPARLRRVAVIGQNARHARTQGGGSATVLPERVVSPLEGLRAALPDADITYTLGAIAHDGLTELPLSHITNPATGEPGMLVRFLDAEGTELFREDRRSTALVYFGGDAPITTAATIELSVTWTPDTTGDTLLGFASVGTGRIHVDDRLLTEDTATAVGQDLGASLLAPPAVTAPLHVTADTPLALRVTFDLGSRDSAMGGTFAITLGTRPAPHNPDTLIAEAARAAAEADVAIVVVGTNSQVESEGFDRTDLALPGHQDALVTAVAATGTPTVVVVNSGSPVLLPWRDDVSALLVTYFAGQEMGNALADVLLGHTEPGGRLPTTWPATTEDVPVLDTTPTDGALHYTEDIHIGYRAWLRSGTTPAYPFGHGLGYTTWTLADLTATTDTIHLTATNTGPRPGKQIIQVYLARPDSTLDRPTRWLATHTTITATPGETVPLTIPLPHRAFATWQPDGWHYEPGPYELSVGTSVTDLPLRTTVHL